MRIREIVLEAIDTKGNWKTFESLPEDAIVVMYHATSRENAEAILANGFSQAAKVWTDSTNGYVFLGSSPSSLAIYGAHAKGDGGAALVVFEVMKGDVEPDDGKDWLAHLRRPGVKQEISSRFGKDAVKRPSATITLAELGQAKARTDLVRAIRIQDF